MCINHGTKVEYKGCSVEGCTNLVQKGVACRRHEGFKVLSAEVKKDLQTNPRKEECASGMELKKKPKYAEV